MNRRQRRSMEREARRRRQQAGATAAAPPPEPRQAGAEAGRAEKLPPVTPAQVKEGVMMMVAKLCRDSTGTDTDWRSRGIRYRYRVPEAYMPGEAEYAVFQVLGDGTLSHSCYVTFDDEGYVATGPALFQRASAAVKLIAARYNADRKRRNAAIDDRAGHQADAMAPIDVTPIEMKAIVRACSFYLNNGYNMGADMSDPAYPVMVAIIGKVAPACGMPTFKVPAEIVQRIEADIEKRLGDAA